MKATGIIRRMDDLGRVVIPKELRKSMKMKEGAPLEIYTHNGAVCFKPYHPLGEKDWEKAKSVLSVILSGGFALLDCYGGIQASVIRDGVEDFDWSIEIAVEGEVVAYLAVNRAENENPIHMGETNKAVQVLKSLFADAV